MKQEVFGNGHGKPGSSPSPVVKTRPNTNHTTTTNTTATARAARRSVKASRDEEELVRAARREENGGKREEEIQRLRGEVEGLRSQVERLQQLNLELEQHKRALAQELLLAQGRIRHLQQQNNAQKTQTPRISNLSEQCKQKEESQAAPLKMASNTKPPSPPPPPPPPAPNAVPRGVPPPPPPPPQQGPARMTTMNEATALVELYNPLTKRDVKKTAVVNGDVAISPHHNGIVGELQNRSTHLLAIKADVETKGEFINDLIKKVQTTTYTDMEQALTFVDWLDEQLSTLSDETAVLKHFNWPERKADALREAAFEYRNLKCVLTEVSSFSDDGTPTSCEATMRKISNLLDKLEKSMNRLMNLRNSVMLSYKEFRIPTDWMLDSGIASKMKLASIKLAKLYMKRVLQELDREMASEMLVAQSVRFTYRAHQFAGGLDSEAMRTFEELRERVRSQGR